MPSAASGTTRPDVSHDEHWTGRHGKPIIFVILTLVAIGVPGWHDSGRRISQVDFPRILVGVDNGVAPIDQKCR
jgi:hypothetical protein